MDRKPDIFEKIAYLGIAIATAKMYVDLHSGRIQSPLGPVLSFFIDFALYYLIYRAGRFVWRKWIKVRVGQEDCEKEPGSASQSEHTFIGKAQPQMDLQAINDYVLSYLGPFLQDEEKDLLGRNIQAFASSDHPELSPILDRKINGYGLYIMSEGKRTEVTFPISSRSASLHIRLVLKSQPSDVSLLLTKGISRFPLFLEKQILLDSG